MSENYTYATGSVTSNQTNTTAQMCGFGSTWKVTPSSSGIIKVSISLTVYGTVGGGVIDMLAVYGTGAAPSLGASVPAGVAQVGPSLAAIPPNNGSFYPCTVDAVATGLTVGTPYWFDLEAWLSSGGGGYEIFDGMAVIEELPQTPSAQSVTAGTSGSPSSVTRDGPHTIVYVSTNSGGSESYVQLPSGTNVGDIFEFYNVNFDAENNLGAVIYMASGETAINASGGVGGDGVNVYSGTFMRKLTSTLWGFVN